jgi:hypothetical protein
VIRTFRNLRLHVGAQTLSSVSDTHRSSAFTGDGAPAGIGRDRRYSWSDGIFVTALVVVCAASVFVGVAKPLGNFGHDAFFFLDNAYRVSQGQVPHRDFSSAWGPITYLIYAAGLALSGMRPSGFGYANAFFGAAIAGWVFLIVRSRWTPAGACALGIYTLLLIVAPVPIGNNPLDFGYAMSYNRYGYALVGIVLMECGAFLLTPHARRPRGINGAISTGVALGLLAFLKISYAMVALGFVAVPLLAPGSHRVRRLAGLSAGFAMVAVLAMSYLRLDFADMLRDLATAATSRRLALSFRSLGVFDWAQNIFLVLVTLLSYTAATKNRDGEQRFLGVLFVLLTIAAGYVLLMTNAQGETFPLNGYAAVALAAAGGPLSRHFRRWPGLSPDTPRVLLVGICLLPFSILNAISLFGAARERQWPFMPAGTAVTSAARGADLQFRPVIDSNTEITGANYVESLNDGIDLLRRHSNREGVLTFDEFNPFNYLLDRPSPRGGIAAAAYDYVFCDAAHPTAERFFGNTNYIMVRKYRNPETDVLETRDVAGLMLIYGSDLRSQFSVVEETEHWVLWRRNGSAPD